MGTPTSFTPFFNLILPTVGGSAVDWSTWTNQNWATVDSTLQTLTTGKVSLNPVDGTLYGRMNNSWVQIDVDGGTVTVGIAEAPNDGNSYLRQSLGWVGANAVIQAIVDTTVDTALSSILRLNVPVSVPVGASSDYIDVNLSHANIRSSRTKFKIIGEFSAGSAGQFVAAVKVSFDGSIVWDSDIQFFADNFTQMPFILDGEMWDSSGLAQFFYGSLLYADEQSGGTLSAGIGGLSKNGEASGKPGGGVFFGNANVNVTGAGTKNLKVTFELLSGPPLSAIGLSLQLITRESF